MNVSFCVCVCVCVWVCDRERERGGVNPCHRCNQEFDRRFVHTFISIMLILLTFTHASHESITCDSVGWLLQLGTLEISVDVCTHMGPQIFCQYALLRVDICAYLAACEFIELCVLFVRKRCMAYWLSSNMLGQFDCLASLWLIELLEAQSPFGPVCVASLQLTELLAVPLHIGLVCLPGLFTASRAVGRPVASVLKCKC